MNIQSIHNYFRKPFLVIEIVS